VSSSVIVSKMIGSGDHWLFRFCQKIGLEQMSKWPVFGDGMENPKLFTDQGCHILSPMLRLVLVHCATPV